MNCKKIGDILGIECDMKVIWIFMFGIYLMSGWLYGLAEEMYLFGITGFFVAIVESVRNEANEELYEQKREIYQLEIQLEEILEHQK